MKLVLIRLRNRARAAWRLLFWPLATPGRRSELYALRTGGCSQCFDGEEVTFCGQCKRGDHLMPKRLPGSDSSRSDTTRARSA